MRRVGLIFALMMGLVPGCGRSLALPAQDATAPASSQTAPQGSASAESSQSASSDEAKAPEQQVAEPKSEKTPEKAEAEKDDTEPLRHSASVRYLAKLFGGDVEKAYWASVLLNFAVIAGLVIWLGRKYLPGFFSDRNAGIQRAMQEAQKASEEARRKLAEIESRLMRLDGEIGMMRDAAEREAAAEEVRIVAATEEEAKKIAAAAGQEIDAAAKAARRELAALAADLAVGLAAKQIHVDTATDQGLVSSFSQQLEGADAPKGGR
jgi:F0F1-type ATP synthase membrane subunit b/b'